MVHSLQRGDAQVVVDILDEACHHTPINPKGWTDLFLPQLPIFHRSGIGWHKSLTKHPKQVHEIIIQDVCSSHLDSYIAEDHAM